METLPCVPVTVHVSQVRMQKNRDIKEPEDDHAGNSAQFDSGGQWKPSW